VLFLLEWIRRRWEYAWRFTIFFLALAESASRADPATLSWENEQEPRRGVLIYNEGVRLERAENLEKAMLAFDESSRNSPMASVRKKALYNLGNLHLRMGDPVLALENYQLAYDTSLPQNPENRIINERLSQNMILAARVLKQMKAGQGGEQEGKNPNPGDQKGPKSRYQTQPFTESEKKKLFDLIANEERQVLQRIHELRNRKHAGLTSEKPW
jgi:tetratricopeptide (TPR) repeat protein